MESFYRSHHEFVCLFKSGKAPHINHIELGKYGRHRTNIWTYAGVNGFGDCRSDLELHPTVKPIAMVADATRDCSRRKGIVLDPFAGSGTTLIAVERTGRPGFCIELDPLYCDVILRRLRSVWGLQAVLHCNQPEIRGSSCAAAGRAHARSRLAQPLPRLLRSTVRSSAV